MPDDCSAFNNIIENYNQISHEVYNLKMLLVFKLQNYGVRDASMSLSFEQLIHMVHNIPSVLCDVDGNIKPTNDVYQDIHLDNISTYNLELYQRILHYIKWLKYYLLLKGVPIEDVANAQTLRDYIVLISQILRIKSTIFDAQYNQLDENDTPTNKIYIGKDNPIDITLMSEDFEDINDGYIVVEEDGEIIQRTRPSNNIDTNQLQIMLAPTQLGEHTYTFYYEGTEQYLESRHVDLILDVQKGIIQIHISMTNITEESNYYDSADTGYIDDNWDINVITTTENDTPIPNVPLTMIVHDDVNRTWSITTDETGYCNVNNDINIEYFTLHKYNSDNNNQPISIEFQSNLMNDSVFLVGYANYLINVYHYPYTFEQDNEYAGASSYTFTLNFIDELSGAPDTQYEGKYINVSLGDNEQLLQVQNSKCQYQYPASLNVGEYTVIWDFVAEDEEEIDWGDMTNGDESNGE